MKISVDNISRNSKKVATDDQEYGSQKADMSKKNEFNALYFASQKVGTLAPSEGIWPKVSIPTTTPGKHQRVYCY